MYTSLNLKLLFNVRNVMDGFLCDLRQGEHSVYLASVQTRVHLYLLYFYLILTETHKGFSTPYEFLILSNISLFDVSVVTDRILLHM